MKHLDAPGAFDACYSQNSIVKKALKAIGISIAVGTATAGGMTLYICTVASPFVFFLAGLPIVGGGIPALIMGEISLPVIIVPAVAAGGIVLIIYKRKKYKIRKEVSGSLDTLAGVVAEVLFLPLFAKCSMYLKKNPGSSETMKKAVKNRLKKWGYTDEFIDDLIQRNLGLPAKALSKKFKNELHRINKLGRDDVYEIEGKSLVYGKYSLPPKAIAKLGKEETNKVNF